MDTIELKLNIHKIIDELQNKQLLISLYEFLKTRDSSQTARLWKTLTQEQQQEVLLAFEESEEDYNLIRREDLL